ncbi:MAG TPA: glycosyltransferase, partial [Candidatus Brocadiia bacterium]|nr:glycosyltransferase [Candidatus Brocadiia bacterium]
MRVGLQTWGSAGDIRPFVALAKALKRAGHEVALAATAVDGRDWSGLCQSLGVPFEPVQEPGVVDLRRFTRRAGGGAAFPRAVNVFIEEMLLGHVDAMTSAARRLCETCDVVVGHFAVFALKAQALRLGRAHASVTFWPGMILTDQCPPHGFPNWGPLWNRMAWKVMRALVDRLALSHAQKVWRGAGLRPFRFIAPEVWFSDRLNLVAASPALWPAPGGWDGRHRLCGWLGLEESRPWAPSGALERFFEAGEAPVFMTLGSAAQVAAGRAEALLMEAARRSGARAIVQSLEPGVEGEVAPGVFRLGPAP